MLATYLFPVLQLANALENARLTYGFLLCAQTSKLIDYPKYRKAYKTITNNLAQKGERVQGVDPQATSGVNRTFDDKQWETFLLALLNDPSPEASRDLSYISGSSAVLGARTMVGCSFCPTGSRLSS